MNKSLTRRRSAQKKAFRKARSRLKKKIYNGAQPNNKVLKTYKVRPSYPKRRNFNRVELIAMMYDSAFPLRIIDIPKVFCLIQAPDESLAFLEEVRKILLEEKCRNIFISHQKTEHLGVAASFLFDQLITESKNYWKSKGIKLGIRGRASDLKSVNNFLCSFGLVKLLGVDPTQQLWRSIDSDYENKFKIYRSTGNSKESHLKGNAATGLTDYFNDCLIHFQQRLTDTGESKLVDAIGELLGNAEEHGGPTVNWHVLGCFEKDSNYAHFAIINYGQSIYESLADEKSTTRDVLEKIEKIILDHRGWVNKVTDYFNDQELTEPIWNVMALQEGISSKRTDDPEGQTRGKGMMDVLQFVSELYEKHEEACIVITSGHSNILVDFTYKIKLVTVGPKMEQWRQIAFNEDAALHLPQDRAKVSYLKNKFPGTIITGRFKLSSEYVKKLNPLETKKNA